MAAKSETIEAIAASPLIRVRKRGSPVALQSSDAVWVRGSAAVMPQSAARIRPAWSHWSPRSSSTSWSPSGTSARLIGKTATARTRNERNAAERSRSSSSAIRENAGKRT